MLKPVKIKPNTSGKSLSDLLEAGEIHAIIGSNLPRALKRNPDVVRLFPDYRGKEQDYYRRTKIFPIMHLIVIRNDVYEKQPVRGDQPLRRILRGQGPRAGKDALFRNAALHAAVAARRRARRSTICSAAIAGPTASSRTGRRWKRWSPTWSSRA